MIIIKQLNYFLMKRIRLKAGGYAIVDDEDYAVLSRLSWHSDPTTKSIYHCYQGKDDKTSRSMSMDYLLLPKTKSKDFRLVHINGDNLDYRKDNLEYWRTGDKLHNNKKAENKTSIYKGVYCDYKFYRWRAYITYEYKRIWIGSFKTEEEAAKAYNEKAKELYGELAYQNKINNNE